MKSALNKRFFDLWQRCLSPASAGGAEEVYRKLLCGYNEAVRNYHNLSHLMHCLDQFDMASHLIPDPDAVEMGLWFHDLVYVPGANDNEQKSAEFFVQAAGGSPSSKFMEKVVELILLTAHKGEPKSLDECFIVDIDLSSLGVTWNVFLIDSENLRKERSDVSDDEYCRRHNEFLKFLLARKRVFQTDFFYARYEQSAIENIKRLLAKRGTQEL